MKSIKCSGLIFVGIAIMFLMSIAIATAQNKVVVIPLIEDAPPLEPFAPVTAVSPPNSAYSIRDQVVVDNVTGLMWQKTDDNTTRGWYEAWEYCLRLSLWTGISPNPGVTRVDWRLPTGDELMSIVDYGVYDPAVNGTAFPGTNASPYWSATTHANYSAEAWRVFFSNGTVSNYSKSYTSFYVRCVRGVPNRQRLFKNNGNGTVTDLATGLTWQRQDDNVERANNGPAAAYCQGLPLAGGGWRLPTVKELQSIVEDSEYNPAIDSDTFPGTNASPYWSATTHADDSAEAWGVYFDHGAVYGASNLKSNTDYVRCVR